MNNYEKPIVVETEELAEGIYAASGGTGGGGACYTVTAYIHQTPENGRENYCIQANATHAAANGHHSTAQVLTLYFNQAVTYDWCSSANASLGGGDGTAALSINYNYHNNANEYIGLGDIYVKSADGLAVTGAKLECNYVCPQHD